MAHVTDFSPLKSQKSIQDPNIIEKRRRSLQRFLKRIIVHPFLGIDHHVHQFLDYRVSWADILRSEQVQSLPLDPALVFPTGSDSLEQSVTMITDTSLVKPVPVPTRSVKLKEPDADFAALERDVEKWKSHLSIKLTAILSRIERHRKELETVYRDLGAAYNAQSLSEPTSACMDHDGSVLVMPLEKIGQAYDAAYAALAVVKESTTECVQDWLLEFAPWCTAAEYALGYRRIRKWQVEWLEARLVKKKRALEKLLAASNSIEHVDIKHDPLNNQNEDHDSTDEDKNDEEERRDGLGPLGHVLEHSEYGIDDGLTTAASGLFQSTTSSVPSSSMFNREFGDNMGASSSAYYPQDEASWGRTETQSRTSLFLKVSHDDSHLSNAITADRYTYSTSLPKQTHLDAMSSSSTADSLMLPPPVPGRNGIFGWFGGLIDVDPVMNRRAQISRARLQINAVSFLYVHIFGYLLV